MCLYICILYISYILDCRQLREQHYTPTSSSKSVLLNSKWCLSSIEDPCSLARWAWDLKTNVHVIYGMHYVTEGLQKYENLIAYFIWYKLLVPRWSISWQKAAATMAKASKSEKYFLSLPVFGKGMDISLSMVGKQVQAYGQISLYAWCDYN